MAQPFVEQLIGTIQGKHLFFWNSRGRQREIEQFHLYFHQARVHAAINSDLPRQKAMPSNSRSPHL
ncbi:MAG: hypothetical protein M2R45_01062 [Verrucomicrobia subdivision 3 bacterium]|nr:hypothetical protein [Limisphaerales bacterium]